MDKRLLENEMKQAWGIVVAVGKVIY